MHRSQELRAAIDPGTQKGLEFGPLDRPVVRIAEGFIRYIDHLETEALREKYRHDPNVDCDGLMPVDYVWGEGSLSDVVGDAAPFDYVIASHVLEHVPDLVGWLQEVAAVLKPRGIVSLAIPDKRYTFDYLRSLSTLGDVLDAFLSHQKRPGSRHVFDHFALARVVDPMQAWRGNLNPPALQAYHTVSEAWTLAKAAQAGAYIDTHVWVFTPDSFRELLALLAELGLFEFKLVRFTSTAVNHIEFFATLQRPEQALSE